MWCYARLPCPHRQTRALVCFCPTESSLSLEREMCGLGQDSAGWISVHSKDRGAEVTQALLTACGSSQVGRQRQSRTWGSQEAQVFPGCFAQLGLSGESEECSRPAWLLQTGRYSKEGKERSFKSHSSLKQKRDFHKRYTWFASSATEYLEKK